MNANRTGTFLVLLTLTLGACQGIDETEVLEDGLTTKCNLRPRLSIDFDGDGLDDKLEDCLLQERAPVVHFSSGEAHLPANLEWMLARSSLAFRHGGTACNSCTVVPQGGLDQRQLTTARHSHLRPATTGGGRFQMACNHDDARVVDITSEGNPHFFLGLPESAERGSGSSSDWKVYGHVYPQGNTVHVQYWLLYPHSEGILWDNHQGDWEQITVRLDRKSGSEVDVIYCAHGECPSTNRESVLWYGTHPALYVAHGTHGNFPDRFSCDRREKKAPAVGRLGIGCRPGGRTWFTGRGSLPGVAAEPGAGVVNVGEKELPRYGHEFISSNLRWGTSADSPPTLSFQGTWKFDPPVTQPVGGPGGTGECEDSCGPNRERVPGSCRDCRCAASAVKDCDDKARAEDNIPWKFNTETCDCFINDGQQ